MLDEITISMKNPSTNYVIIAPINSSMHINTLQTIMTMLLIHQEKHHGGEYDAHFNQEARQRHHIIEGIGLNM